MLARNNPNLTNSFEERTISYTTPRDSITLESLNARFRRAVRARGHFPNEQAAIKCLYLAIRSVDPTRPRTATLCDPVEARTQRLRALFEG